MNRIQHTMHMMLINYILIQHIISSDFLFFLFCKKQNIFFLQKLLKLGPILLVASKHAIHKWGEIFFEVELVFNDLRYLHENVQKK